MRVLHLDGVPAHWWLGRSARMVELHRIRLRDARPTVLVDVVDCGERQYSPYIEMAQEFIYVCASFEWFLNCVGGVHTGVGAQAIAKVRLGYAHLGWYHRCMHRDMWQRRWIAAPEQPLHQTSDPAVDH